MSTKESWQLITRKSALVPRVDVSIDVFPETMRGPETRKKLQSCIKISTAAFFVANVAPNLTSLTRTMTPKLASEESDESLPR